MRFSAVQEDGCGVGLGQEKSPNNNVINDSMMAALGDTVSDSENTVEECSMTYNLPLLFANGYPTSLDKISLLELEKFITFMVQCSSGGPTITTINQPQWWPKEIRFSHPFVRPPKISDNWIENLKKLVFRCYTYHRSEYLLRFCSCLAQYPKDKLYYVNNWDSTTSLFHKNTGKLLATFRNENMEYDKIVESPRRPLLLPNGVASNSSKKTKKAMGKEQSQMDDPSLVVIQPRLEEIYLCDNCDAEFGDLQQMKDHDKICNGPVTTNITPRPVTPCEVIVEPELDQNKFLDYFKLLGINEKPKSLSIPTEQPVIVPVATKCMAESTRSSRRMKTTVNLSRSPMIPFSSPAGIAIGKKSRMITEELQLERLERLERHMEAKPLCNVARPKWLDRLTEYNRWSVTYKPHREKSTQSKYVHKYTFGGFKRKFALSIRSQILYVACRALYIRLERLTNNQLEDLKKHPWKYRSPIRKVTPRNRPKSMTKVGQAQIAGVERKTPAGSSDIAFIKEEQRKTSSSIVLHDVIKPKPFCSQRRSEPTKTIILVDLCSSDEEDVTPNPVLSDENLDPLLKPDNSARANFFKNLALHTGKFRSKSLGYPSDSVNEWIRDSVLTDENEKFSSTVKCLGNVIDPSNQFAPILKPGP